jgi:hypothetical protein
MRTVKAPLTQLLQRVPSVPSPPSGGSGHSGRGGRSEPVVWKVEANSSNYSQFLAGEIRKYVRVQGNGDVQLAFGQ